MNILSSIERSSLLLKHKKERDDRICDRLKVLLWYDKEMPVEEISKLLFLSPKTAKRHIKEYNEEKKLQPSNGNSITKLSEDQSKELSTHLEEKLYTKVKDISEHILEIYGIKYSNSGLTNWLREQNFTYKKPVGIPSKIDEAKQLEFILKYKKLEKELSKNKEILFMDSCHPTQSTKFDYVCIKKVKEKHIKTTALRTRVNITEVININSKEVITGKYDTINSESTIRFLEKVLLYYTKSKKINIIEDGAGSHKSKEVKKFTKDKNIEIHTLPPYSPNLNPIERLWKIMNEYVRNNKYYKTAKKFRSAIDDFFLNTIPIIPEILKNRINSNFQIITNSS